MRTIKFGLVEKSRANKLYIVVEYAGGDADTEHPVEVLLKAPFSEWESNLEEIRDKIEFYQKLKTILESGDEYDEIEEAYGKEMANAWDNVPNDPQNDYQDKCYIDDLKLVGYDKEGNKYESYV
jgi:hypothetical protein